jgi:Mg-chelatase subunit ChlD
VAITFLLPLFLLLLPIAALPWLLRGRARARTHLVLRGLVFLTLVLAVAQPVLLTSDNEVYQVFVADYSASVGAGARAHQRDAIARLLERAGRRRATALVVMGDADWRGQADALDPSAVGAVVEVSDAQSPSSMGAALAAAARRIPEGARGVVHLFSDGLATDRRWAPEVQQLIDRGIIVNTYDLGLEERDVYPAGLATSELLRIGQTARVDVDVIGAASGLRVRLLGRDGGEIASSAPIDSSGRVRVPVTFEPETPGFLDVTAEVVVAAGQDANPRNNTLSRSLPVQEPVRLLYLGERVRGAAPRIASLLGRGFHVTDGSQSRLDGAFDFSGFDLVLIDDRPASLVPVAFQERLADAVAHQGLGFVFSGGKSAFGTGGYETTPIASIAPVEFVQRTEKRDPSAALAIIIDTSGSMTGTRMDLAKQVARLAVRRLKAHDRVGIVEFYGNKHWALPLQSAANKIAIDRAIGRMQATGGTVMMPALEEGYYGLKNVDTRYKHLLVITDAGVESSDYEAMIRRIAKDGITVSTVLVGAQANNQLMIDMASWGKGRFYTVVDRYNLPELILKQPSTMKLPSYKAGAFSVQSRGGEGWWSDINRRAMPPVSGYVETTVRDGADALMEIDGTSDPLLATWRYGLGRVTALMTEPVGDGTRGWSNWPEYGRLLARVLTRTADDMRLFDYTVARADHVVTLTARRQSRDATLQPQAVVLDDGGRSAAALAFRQDAPGHFSATVSVDPRAPLRLLASATSPATPGIAHQPTRLVSTMWDDVSPEQQVDPDRGLDLESLANATGGTYTDLAGVAVDVAAVQASTPGDAPSQAWSVFRLWPLLLVLSLLLYLSEIVYRRWPHQSAKVAA